MSAFVVQPETISRIIDGLHLIARDTSYAQSKLAELGYSADVMDSPGYTKLGQAMLDLNVAAVNHRYQEQTSTDAPYRHRCSMPDKFQAYKSLECWLYQCTEGTIPQEPLFKVMEDVVKPILADMIISRLPQYAAAKWD